MSREYRSKLERQKYSWMKIKIQTRKVKNLDFLGTNLKPECQSLLRCLSNCFTGDKQDK